MGQLIEGRWVEEPVEAGSDAHGRFIRQSSTFRHKLGDPDFPVEPGRYHIYIQHACPWCHRVHIVHQLKKLDGIVSISSAHPHMLTGGWRFTPDYPDPLNGHTYVHELYLQANPRHTGRATVPILWDKHRQTIVNNESSEIIAMLSHVFDEHGADTTVDPYPAPLQAEIDAFAETFYNTVNNGVYRCGFAHTQEAYEEAFDELFAALDGLEEHLAGRAYLVGDQLTLADIRLWVTLIRFDAVYVTHFKCNLRRLTEYPNLQAYTERLYRVPAFKNTTEFWDIKQHYYYSHDTLNPKRIVPKGFLLPFEP